MKTRIDFVSNSSSCSFIIAIGKNFTLNDFIKETCDGCLKHCDEDDNDLFVISQNEFNNAVLNYHLRASELLYLGGLKIGNIKTTVSKDDEYFSYLKDNISKQQLYDERVVENTDDYVVIETDDVVYGMAIPKRYVEYVTMEYHWNDNYKCDIKKQKNAAIEIVKFAKNYSDHKADYKSRYNSNTDFISRSTIWNTRALIAAGYEVELEKWMDLDKLDKMLQNDDKIFNIRVNNGGDGVSEDALFTFGGWDGEDVFENMSGVEVLSVETM